MRIFLSHASEQTEIAESIAVALRGERHVVFLDRSALPSGETYNDRIREALSASDLFVFLVSPEAVTKGRYTITELELAEQRWSSPSDHVLPVVIRPTEFATIPPYLKAVTLLEPQGNIPAAVAAAVGQMANPRWRRIAWPAIAALVVLCLVGAAFLARRIVQQRRLADEVSILLKSGRLEQQSRHYAAAWDWYGKAAVLAPRDANVARTQQQLAIDWLENIRVTVGQDTFTAIVGKIEPVLVRCAGGADTQRAADCMAHLGWGDFLRWRDGAAGLDPVQRYRRALELDPKNVYGHAMWGFELIRTDGSAAAAKKHFDQALAAGRERAYVRSLQLAALFWRHDSAGEDEALRVANDMRLHGESLSAETGSESSSDIDRLWNIYSDRVLNRHDLASFLSALSPADHLATFQWLFPVKDSTNDKQDLQLFVLATLQEHAGEREAALANYQALRARLANNGALTWGGSLPDQTVAAVKRLSRK